ncbi:MAG TPA: uroporphyrinogen decarboxylase family protein [Thermoflexales bacterium]|nr:uroporphyrinogen decarboxylase family protein [Thermoflexales bacterium]
MTTFTKLQRFNAAVKGDSVDHLPISAWVHFASEHLSAHETARLHIAFFKAYDWDYVKAMNDYRFPLPAGVDVIRTAEDLRRFAPLGLTSHNFAEQLACLRQIRAGVGPDVAILETLFDPLQTLVRASGADVRELIFANPEAGHAALEAVTHSLIGYITALKLAGVNGLFYSINGAVEPGKGGLTDAQFAEFVAPYDQRILRAADGLTRVAHVHGFDLRFDRCANYPVEVFSWSHLKSKPSLAEARKLTSAALMGGMDETAIAKQSVDDLRRDIETSVAEAGASKLILGPGCTLPPDTPLRLMKAAKEISATFKV